MAGGVEVQWKNDLWGCRPIVMPRQKQGNQTADLDGNPGGQTPTQNAAVVLEHKDTAKMSMVAGNKAMGMQITNSKIVPMCLVLPRSQMVPFFTQEAQKFVDPENQPLLLRSWGFKQNLTSDIPTRGDPNAPAKEYLQQGATKQVPAVEFPDFKNLPSEVKIMIWDSALPTFIEVIVNEDKKQYVIFSIIFVERC